MKEINFVPKARLIKILGEQLIKDATVGIIELVKNSYDADATEVEITINSLNTTDASIIIRDNGVGMDLHTFTTKWMNPATGHKEEQKENKKRTKLKRLPLGEKGVGRFAAQQIGNQLKMISKTIESKEELFVDVDWSMFDVRGKDLHEVKVSYKIQESDRFKYKESGTILEITNLKSEWTKDEIGKVSNSLRRMKSPFKGANNFNVKLKFENCPEEIEKYANLETSDILNKAHYKFFAIVSNDGKIDFEYKFKMPGFNESKDSGQADIRKETDQKINNLVSIGDFIINLHAYDRGIGKLNKADRDDLNEWSGVNVYRDGIRIMPYGEKGNDWLNLDNRRIQNPGKRLGNDQVIGMVELNQAVNEHLKDKTNREGLIENEYYEKFHSLILGTIAIFEAILYDDRKKVNPKKEKTSNERIEAKAIDVKTELNEIKKKVEASDFKTASETNPIITKVENQVTELTQHVTDTIDELEKDKQILFNLAGTGLAAERFTHEFARLISGSISSLERLKKLIDYRSNPKVKKEVDSISAALEALRNDIRLLGPMFYIKKVAKEKDLNIRKIIQNTISLQEPFIEKEGIEMLIEGNSFNVMMREGSCMQIFNNLIDNAVFWCSRKSETDKKQIKILIEEKEKTVYVTDSGPGVATRYRDKIFEPFFSMKSEDGRGLGLYIVKEILDEKNFGIYLLAEEDYKGLLSGASFKIVFNDNKE